VACADERIRAIMGDDTDPSASLNLGMLIDEEIAVPGVEGQPVREHPLHTVRRVQRMVNTMTGARDNALIDEFGKEVCRLPAKGHGEAEFDKAKTETRS